MNLGVKKFEELLDAAIEELTDRVIEAERAHEIPCCSENHDMHPVHGGPGVYWVIPGHPCFWDPQHRGQIVALCAPVVEYYRLQSEMFGGQAHCPECDAVVTLPDILTIVGMVGG